jgi:hypothetical protein
MSKNVTITGSLQYTPATNARDALLPLNLQLAYRQKSIDDLEFSVPVTDQEINFGTITTPKVVLIECTEGEASFKLNALDAGVVTLAMNPSPLPTDRSIFLWTNPMGAALTLFVTVAAAAKLSVTAFQ